MALIAIDVFLQLNGYELTASEIDAAYTIEALAAGQVSEEALGEWVEGNMGKVL